MGLDQNLLRKYIPKDIVDRAVLGLSDDDAEYEEVFYWRKDYDINEWLKKNVRDFENCEYVELSKNNLILFRAYLLSENGNFYQEFKDETKDYDDEIKKLNEIIENHDNEDYVYYYWAWW